MLCFFLLVVSSSGATCSELLSRHRRGWIVDSFTIEEGLPGPFPYELGKINIERSYPVHFDLFGEGVDEDPKGVLSIHKESGTVYVHRAVDYEEHAMLKLKFEARKTDSSIETSLKVEITILDINDNPPRFQRDLFGISVGEETTQGSHLLTVVAFDRDQRGTPNSTFHYEIKSVAPNTPDTEFFIDESGSISFKGCLDHEVAEMFTVVVEAKDHGDVVSLSSSTTVVIHVEGGNNHLPTISGHTGSGKVKEDEIGSSPLRLHASDEDAPNSRGWRATYTIQGDPGVENFEIQTDPDTNDGILTVIKPFDFEAGARVELTISVENEAPYSSCRVTEKTPSGLWKVDSGDGEPRSVKVAIEVEDANDAPRFSAAVKEAALEENAPVGTWVEKVGSDPAGWVTVDPQTGDVTTAETPDRESPHVVNGVYTVVLHAVDDGKTQKPPSTGTATLTIHVTDENDNVPQPTADYVHVCVSDSPTTANISAFDPDENPFGGPFTFELLGDVKRNWKLNPSYGYTAGLVKEPGVSAGPHTIDLKISDMQGKFAVYSLGVTACDCSVTSDCRSRAATKAASGAMGVAMFASLLLLAFVLLMAVVVTCKEESIALDSRDSSGETLLVYNTETPGTDCQVAALKHLQTKRVIVFPRFVCMQISVTAPPPLLRQVPNSFLPLTVDEPQHIKASTTVLGTTLIDHCLRHSRRESSSYLFNGDWNQKTWTANASKGFQSNRQIDDTSTMDFGYKRKSSKRREAALLSLLREKLSGLETEEDLREYPPHLYADEGDSGTVSELDSISIPDEDSVEEATKDLGPNFKQLAVICKPPHTQNDAYQT
ncbi:cadherin-like protein 26 [Pseudoliparis swirei]|uniref:cadherin-like protein 26 n=1 Tax=Pseudoliparis swirei TaxID=2059687 RepID=UPI0024BD9ADE|nr:cadherin-like protein 26 [Pseudoliparis swirei]